MKSFKIDFSPLPGKQCRIAFSRDLSGDIAHWIKKQLPDCPVAVISDTTVAGLYAEKLMSALQTTGCKTTIIDFPPGESSKNLQTLGGILERMQSIGMGRDGLVIALGGGVTGDIAGLAASLYSRGLPWIQLPTTTLAMADSAIGGKTAVNLAGVKNLVGTFHQPRAFFADIETLKTLPQRHFKAGLAEVVKTSLIADAVMFTIIEKSAESLLDCENDVLFNTLFRSARIKSAVVSRDERESGERAILNAGHTIGHAVEAVSKGALLHGEAVAVGMALECRLAVRASGFPEEDVARIEDVLQRLGLPVRLPENVSLDDLAGFIELDKKNRGGKIGFALPKKIGVFNAKNDGWVTYFSERELKQLLVEIV